MLEPISVLILYDPILSVTSLLQAAGVLQFADGNIKVGKCSDSLPKPPPHPWHWAPCGMPREFGGAPSNAIHTVSHVVVVCSCSCTSLMSKNGFVD
ncbi:unnamed protein product [Pieris macdunnoughi]|uniref:Uncharacterized protein n=1 Tax=Pieris macdunnoughi TaxID=345717 RepID=A0A821P4W9_9NEOP|nr:unnamed protein product [Pieris macdunnoughi]